jgi:hypothetical protein
MAQKPSLFFVVQSWPYRSNGIAQVVERPLPQQTLLVGISDICA